MRWLLFLICIVAIVGHYKEATAIGISVGYKSGSKIIYGASIQRKIWACGNNNLYIGTECSRLGRGLPVILNKHFDSRDSVSFSPIGGERLFYITEADIRPQFVTGGSLGHFYGLNRKGQTSARKMKAVYQYSKPGESYDELPYRQSDDFVGRNGRDPLSGKVQGVFESLTFLGLLGSFIAGWFGLPLLLDSAEPRKRVIGGALILGCGAVSITCWYVAIFN